MLETEQLDCMQWSSRATGKGMLILPASPLPHSPFLLARASPGPASPKSSLLEEPWLGPGGPNKLQANGEAFQKEIVPSSAALASRIAVPCHESPKKNSKNEA